MTVQRSPFQEACRIERGTPALCASEVAVTFRAGEVAESLALLGLEAEVEPRIVLEHETPSNAVYSATDDDERGHEAECLKFPLEFGRVPHLPMLRFEVLTAPWCGVDLSDHLTTNEFSRVRHA
jgi:hypothetical protein